MDRFETFTVLIAKISRSIRKLKSNEMAKFNLKSPHVSVLYYLTKNGDLTAKGLCDICDEDKAQISRSIEYLEKNGFIKCESKTEKRYKSPLILTEKGKQAGDSLVQEIDRVLSISSFGLTAEDMEIFYKCLFKICENLENVIIE